MTSRKTLYEEFCRAENAPIYFQPWWLDVVCGPDNWSAAVSVDAQGRVWGVLPYFRTKRWGLAVILQAPMSTYSGPLIHYPDQAGQKPSYRIHFEKKVYSDLIGQLPAVALFRQNFRPDVTNWLPFFWNGFRQTTRYTYILNKEEVRQSDALLQSVTRKKIRQSESLFDVYVSDDFDAYLRLLQHTYRRRQLSIPLPLSHLRTVYQTAHARGNGILLLARHAVTREIVAGFFLLHNNDHAALVSSAQHTGAELAHINYRMIWECIQWCARQGCSLDFEGSMDPGMEHLLRAFGGRLTPYFQVWKTGNRLLEMMWNGRGA